MPKSLLLLLSLILTTIIVSAGLTLAQDTNPLELVSVESAYSVDETVSRLQATLADQGLTLVTTVNHAANAQSVAEELPPTQLIIFGNPNAGTPLMQSSQTTAIDLPQKFLVWEDEAGRVYVTYNAPQYLANRHNISGQDERINQIATVLENLALSMAPVGPVTDTATVTATVATLPTSAPATPELAPTQAIITPTATLASVPPPRTPTPTATPVVPAALPETGEHTSPFSWLLIVGGLLLAGSILVWRARRAGGLLLLAVPFLVGALLLQSAAAQSQEVAGLMSVESPYSVDETVTRLQSALDENNFLTVATINHTANGANVGLELRPTQLIIFGNPAIGTQLMQSSRTIGIDLPQKFLVWEDEAGHVWVTYNNPHYLANRHGITDRDEVIARVTTALGNLAAIATAE